MKKILFFHDAARKTRTTCKISTFFGDLNFLKPRSHLKKFPRLKGFRDVFFFGKWKVSDGLQIHPKKILKRTNNGYKKREKGAPGA